MNDRDAIAFLAGKLGTSTAVARSLNVTPQTLNNWLNEGRGISHAKRPAVWALVNDHGGNLPRDWLMARAA